MKKYLLLAGTGAIGSYLIKELAADNNEVFVTSRSNRAPIYGEKYLLGNPHDFRFIKRLFAEYERFDVIVDFMVWQTQEFENIFMVFLNHCDYYVYMSSSRIYSGVEGRISESTERLYDSTDDKRFLRKDTYAVPKSEQEDILIKSNMKNYVLIRPYITYSESRLPFCSVEKEIWLYRILHGRTLVIPDDLSMKNTTLMFGEDCAKAIYNIIYSQKYRDEAINVATNEYVTWDHILQLYLKVLNERGIEYKLKRIKKSEKIKNRDYQALYDRNYNREFDVSKLTKIVDTDSFKGVDKGLEECLVNFLSKPIFNQSLQDWRFQAQLDKITHERAKREEFISSKEYLRYIAFRYLPLNRIRRFIKKCIPF